MEKRILCLILVLVMVCLFAGCEQKQSKTFFSMDTVMQAQIWGEENTLEAVQSLVRQLDDRWSAHSGNSLLGQLNRGEDAKISPEEAALLERVEELSLRTGGTFDPKMRCVSLAWGFTDGVEHVPAEQELQTALTDRQWDLGGALKGYAGDRAAELLEEMGAKCALLNLGGNVQTYGAKPDGTPWSIGIQNPNGGDPVGTVSVVGTMAVVTSGDYQRYFEKDGVRYHHILNPETGKPAQSGLSSVTVICREGLTADVLSTALFVMGLEKGADFWRQSDDFEAVFITDDGRIYTTQGAVLSGCEYEVIGREN